VWKCAIHEKSWDAEEKKPRLEKKEKEKERRGDTSAGLPCIAIRPLRCGTKTNRIQQH
jgi:hypothetical protein